MSISPIPIIKDITDIVLDKNWKLCSKNELINDEGKIVKAEYNGRQYQIIYANRDYPSLIRSLRVFCGTLLLICTLATALFLTQVQNLFLKTSEMRKYRLLINDPFASNYSKYEPTDGVEDEPTDEEQELSLLESMPTEIVGKIFENLSFNDLLQLDQTSQTISTHIAQNSLFQKHMKKEGLYFHWNCSEKTKNPDKSNLILNILLRNYFHKKEQKTLPGNYRAHVADASPFLNTLFFADAYPNLTQSFPIEEILAKQRLDMRWGVETLLYALLNMIRTNRVNFDLFARAIEKNATIASLIAVQFMKTTSTFGNLEVLFSLCKLSAERKDFRSMNLLLSSMETVSFAVKKFEAGYRYPPILASLARFHARKFQFKKAFYLYRKVVRALGNKTPSWILAETGFVLDKLSHKEKAYKYLNKALKINIGDIPADALVILAGEKFEEKNWQQAKKLYKAANNALGRNHFFMRLNQAEKEDLNKKLLAKLIILYERLGEGRKALSYLKRAIQDNDLSIADLKNEGFGWMESLNIGYKYYVS